MRDMLCGSFQSRISSVILPRAISNSHFVRALHEVRSVVLRPRKNARPVVKIVQANNGGPDYGLAGKRADCYCAACKVVVPQCTLGIQAAAPEAAFFRPCQLIQRM